MESDYAASYVQLWQTHWWWVSRHQFITRQLQQLREQDHEIRDGKILDIGCAGGVAFDTWSQFGSVYGIEPDAELCGAVPKWSERVTNMPFEEGLDYPETDFDIILMLDVLEHLEDDAGALREIRRRLRPGGSLILTVPAMPVLWSQHDVINKHFRRYTKSTLQKVIHNAGLKVESLHPLFTWSVPLLFLRKLVPARSYEVKTPGKLVNQSFLQITRIENTIRNILDVPWGSSLFCIAKSVSSKD